MKNRKCVFRINNLLQANTPIALLIHVESKLTDEDRCKDICKDDECKEKTMKNQTPTRFCNMTGEKFMKKIGLNPESDRTKPFTDYFLPDYYHCGKSVCYQPNDNFEERCDELRCPYPKCCGCQKSCLDKSFCEAFEIKIQTKNTTDCEYPCVHEPTVTKVGFQIAISWTITDILSVFK